jgi:hypothetical protein
MDPSMRDY